MRTNGHTNGNGTNGHRRAERLGPTPAELAALPSEELGRLIDLDEDDGEPEDWGDLAPAPWPARPVGAYHGLAGELVGSVEFETEADPTAILGQLLVGAGNAMGRGSYFSVGPRRQHANLFMALVGRSSRARKGTSWSWAEYMLGLADKAWSSGCKINGLSTKEGVLRHLQEAHDKRVLSVEEELAGVLGVMERQGNTLSACLRQAFDTGSIRTTTRGEPLRVEGAHVSLIGHITHADLLAMFSDQQARNGMGNRILWVCSRRSRQLPLGGKVPDLRGLIRPLAKALAQARRGGEFVLSTRARALWVAEYGRLTSEEPGLYGELTARAETMVQRLALVYALLDRARAIELAHLRAALSFWRFSAACVAHVFGRAAASGLGARLQKALADAGDAGLNRREAHARLGGNYSSLELKRAITELLRLDRIEIRPAKPHGVRLFFKELPHDSPLRANEQRRRRSP